MNQVEYAGQQMTYTTPPDLAGGTCGLLPEASLLIAGVKRGNTAVKSPPTRASQKPTNCLTNETLAKSPDFRVIGDVARTALCRATILRQFTSNEFIYLQDDEARYLYFVVCGHIRLSYLMEDGSAVLHAILPPGESFGELGVFERSTYCDMATAIGPVTTASISVQSMEALSVEFPEIGQALARLVARRYRGYVQLTRDLSLKTLSARLAQSVLRLAKSLGTRARHRGRDVSMLGAVVTQTDLGLMARGSRGNVNRVLKAWERIGWIAIEERCILILNPLRLERLAAEDC